MQAKSKGLMGTSPKKSKMSSHCRKNECTKMTKQSRVETEKMFCRLGTDMHKIKQTNGVKNKI